MFHRLPPFSFRSKRDHRIGSKWRELRTRKSRSLGPFHARQNDRDPVIAAHFDFESDAGLEVEVKVKFAELVGRCQGDGTLAPLEHDWNRIELTVGPDGVHNLAHEGDVPRIGLRLKPEIRHEIFGLIDHPPSGKLCGPDASGHRLQKTVEDEAGSIYDAAKDGLGAKQRFQAAPKFLVETVARYAGKGVSLQQVFDFRFAR